MGDDEILKPAGFDAETKATSPHSPTQESAGNILSASCIGQA